MSGLKSFKDAKDAEAVGIEAKSATVWLYLREKCEIFQKPPDSCRIVTESVDNLGFS